MSRKLIKYVIVDDAGTWYAMYDNNREDRAHTLTPDRPKLHVEQWTYHEKPDGTHKPPSKVRLPEVVEAIPYSGLSPCDPGNSGGPLV